VEEDGKCWHVITLGIVNWGNNKEYHKFSSLWWRKEEENAGATE
jgi:hypothetical protein